MADWDWGWLTNAVDSAANTAEDVYSGAGDSFGNFGTEVMDFFGGAGEQAASTIQSTTDILADAFSPIGSAFGLSNVVNPDLSGISNLFGTSFSNAVNTVETGLGGVQSALSDLFNLSSQNTGNIPSSSDVFTVTPDMFVPEGNTYLKIGDGVLNLDTGKFVSSGQSTNNTTNKSGVLDSGSSNDTVYSPNPKAGSSSLMTFLEGIASAFSGKQASNNAAALSACPRGSYYDPGVLGNLASSCDNGYIMRRYTALDNQPTGCYCGNATNTGDSTSTNSPSIQSYLPMIAVGLGAVLLGVLISGNKGGNSNGSR